MGLSKVADASKISGAGPHYTCTFYVTTEHRVSGIGLHLIDKNGRCGCNRMWTCVVFGAHSSKACRIEQECLTSRTYVVKKSVTLLS